MMSERKQMKRYPVCHTVVNIEIKNVSNETKNVSIGTKNVPIRTTMFQS
jgi:hypothetical protein